MTIRKFTVALHLYVPYDQCFGKWKTDKPEIAMMTQSTTAECQEKGHIDFIWIQDSLLSVLSAENLFQYEHFHENLEWTAVRARKPGIV